MSELWQALQNALWLMFSLDPGLMEIMARSLYVTVCAVMIATLISLPLAGFLVLCSFPGRGFVMALLNALMGLPPVAVGLVVYLLFSRSGPLGVLGLLFTPVAMITAQVIIIAPLIASVSAEVMRRHYLSCRELLISLNARRSQRIITLARESRNGLVVALLAGFGRGIGEVGAIMIVGGNIDHATRVLTTAIATETSRGNISLALALGLVLIFLSLGVNILAHVFKKGDAEGARW